MNHNQIDTVYAYDGTLATGYVNNVFTFYTIYEEEIDRNFNSICYSMPYIDASPIFVLGASVNIAHTYNYYLSCCLHIKQKNN